MKGLITPPGILMTVAMLGLYGLYAAAMAFIEFSVMYAIVSVLAITACLGTAVLRPWSRFLVYTLTAGFTTVWVHSVYRGLTVGYFQLQFASPIQATKSLAPGLLLVVLSCACSWIVFRHFRRSECRSPK